ncbi:MAG: hypothetical protein BWY57_00159 [Betaproteobacteria bacterium ADurb.Bin341]|nr:MAG: hypothetical protein BWY57_00159 [Betaproteobacteria bacterium ADurb.Bin341]HOG01611.1 hypothetical protein [Clostridia bacterium]HPK16086.1 hypothetical protein [Clostridia bacterium]
MAAKRKKEEWVDDGRVIANMNVEGMPDVFYRRSKRKKFDEFGEVALKPEPVRLTREEKRAISGGVSLAFIAVLVGFGLLFGLFLLFCSKIWFS